MLFPALLLALGSGSGSEYPPNVLATRAIPIPLTASGYGFRRNSSVDLEGDLALAARFDPFSSGIARSDRAYWVDVEAGVILAELFPPDPSAPYGFGGAVALRGKRAFIGHDTNDEVHAYDLPTGEHLATLSGPAGFGQELRADGSLLAVASDSAVTIHDVRTLAELGRIELTDVFAFDLEGDLLVASSKYIPGPAVVRLYDAPRGAFLSELSLPPPTDPYPSYGGSRGPNVSIVEDQVVVALDFQSSNKGRAYVFDAGSGALVDTLLPPCPFATTLNFGYEMSRGSGRGFAIGEHILGSTLCDTLGFGAIYVYPSVVGPAVASLVTTDPGVTEFGWTIAQEGRRVITNSRTSLLVFDF